MTGHSLKVDAYTESFIKAVTEDSAIFKTKGYGYTYL